MTHRRLLRRCLLPLVLCSPSFRILAQDAPSAAAVFGRGIYIPDEPAPVAEKAVEKPADVAPVPPPKLTAAEVPVALPAKPASPDVRLYGPREQEIARRAWQYFAASRQKRTGLYDSVLHYPAATIWDIGSAIAGSVAGEKLGLLQPETFKAEMKQLLASLNTMPLYHDELPNREYDIRTLRMLGRDSKPSEKGTGWSALDIGRILTWLKIVALWYPDLRAPAEGVVARWKFARLRTREESFGVSFDDGKEFLRQEGRLGYEQYAARGFRLWNQPVLKAEDYHETEPYTVYGIALRREQRTHAFLTSEPFVLAAMEIGSIDPEFDRLGDAVFQVQKKRWQETGVLTAVSEDAVDVAPWFVYNTILHDGVPWTAVSPGGQAFPNLKNVSTKVAFAYAALSDDDYAVKLEAAVLPLGDPSFGYFGGLFDKGTLNRSLNLNTNAIVLEAMLFRKTGRRPFLTIKAEDWKVKESL
jgi:hypothetical protein